MIADTAELFNQPRLQLRDDAGVLGPGGQGGYGAGRADRPVHSGIGSLRLTVLPSQTASSVDLS